MDVEQRARELLAAEYKARGELVHAMNIEKGGLSVMYAAEIAAIVAALTPPEGYEKVVRDAARYNYVRRRLLDTCMRNDAGELIFCDSRNGPELDELIDSEIDGHPEVPDGRG
ncbi:TPA: hypothetical protein R4K21_001401 [Stenotrophomonas maltophilia]|nr:hypothetical protein [Stenotrophomonas maltophilia]